MDFTVILAIFLIVVGVALVVGLIGFVAVFFFWRIRRSSAKKAEVAAAPAPAPAKPAPKAPEPAPAPPPPPAPAAGPPSAPPAAAPLQPSPPPPAQGDEPTTRMPALKPPSSAKNPPDPKGALGFFDDDYATNTSADAARTELFQRGAQAFDWDDEDDDEGGATEVFSAHHMDELGSDFTIEDEPDP